MNGSANQNRTSTLRMSYDSNPTKSPPRRRKTNGFRGVIRKIFGRKPVKSQIGLPGSNERRDHDPNAFITTATGESGRYQRATSLPIPNVNRNSALGSHAPFAENEFDKIPKRTQVSEIEVFPRERVVRRRNTLPSVILSPLEHEAIMRGRAPSRNELDGDQDSQNEYGFAVTKGAHPKRRSQSANRLYDLARDSQISPTPVDGGERRRSEEIAYWRHSLLGIPTPLSFNDQRQFTPDLEGKQVGGPSTSVTNPEESEQADPDGGRNTFDFGLLATTIQDQDEIGLEERVVTVEVKLMDLEYAISKLQARTPSPVEPSSKSHSGIPETPAQSRTQHALRNDPCENQYPGHLASPAPSASEAEDDENTRQGPRKRPISTATMVRQKNHHSPRSPPSPVETSYSSRQDRHRSSLTSMTIDHFTTLVSLLRKEQSARVNLQQQVTELQRQIQDMQQNDQHHHHHVFDDSSPSPTSQQSWSHHSYKPAPKLNHVRSHHSESGRTGGLGGGERHTSEFDATDTEDGYLEAYGTPNEQTEFARPLYGGIIEGEAF
ncbi:hypothetical protein MMC25_002466 [Agyrium rufum]|nr:hypothetical protein [Agyrium rufum]